MPKPDAYTNFLCWVDSGLAPDQATLKEVAAGLRQMQRGKSFRTAFNLKRKRGRKELVPAIKAMAGFPITNEYAVECASDEKLRARVIFKIGVEYYIARYLGRRSYFDAKDLVWQKFKISERTFDSRLSEFHKELMRARAEE